MRTGDGNQAACVERDIEIEHGAHAVDDGAVHDRNRRIEVPSYFAPRPGEVEHCAAGGFVNLHTEADLAEASSSAAAMGVGEGRTGEPSSRYST